MKYLNSVAYVLLIVLVNWLFTVVPLVELPGGTMWPPVSLLVGFVFVARDFAQREVGHWVLALMAVGVVLSYFMASPQVAFASATAFLISELLDWAVYTYQTSVVGAHPLLQCAWYSRRQHRVPQYAGIFLDRRGNRDDR